jgi:hypothetical protein
VAHNGEGERADPSRRRVLKAGQIFFNGRSSTMSCTVRFLSDWGAWLDVSNSEGLPNRFDLVVKSDGLDKACRVVAQTQTRIDVHFA